MKTKVWGVRGGVGEKGAEGGGGEVEPSYMKSLVGENKNVRKKGQDSPCIGLVGRLYGGKRKREQSGGD